MGQRLRLDHLVYAVPDLDQATARLEAEIGASVLPGGRHEVSGTHNAILPLDRGTYLELIAADPDNPSPPLPRPFGLDASQEARLATWAVRSLDIASDVERLLAKGYDPGPVFPASRVSPAGERLEWKLAIGPDLQGTGLIPFIIDWEAAPHPSEAADGAASRSRLRSLHGIHPDRTSVLGQLAKLGAELEVRDGPEALLCAEIEGPSGTIKL